MCWRQRWAGMLPLVLVLPLPPLLRWRLLPPYVQHPTSVQTVQTPSTEVSHTGQTFFYSIVGPHVADGSGVRPSDKSCVSWAKKHIQFQGPENQVSLLACFHLSPLMGCRDQTLKTNADYLRGSKHYGAFSKDRGRSMWREQARHPVSERVRKSEIMNKSITRSRIHLGLRSPRDLFYSISLIFSSFSLFNERNELD